MVYRTSSGDIGSIDYREMAPMSSTEDMYLDKEGKANEDLRNWRTSGWSSWFCTRFLKCKKWEAYL